MQINPMGQKASTSFQAAFEKLQKGKDSLPPKCDLFNLPFFQLKNTPGGTKLRVASFNILAHNYLYRDCGEFSEESLHMTEPNHRVSNLHQVIKNLNADILCLQEVDDPISSTLFQHLSKKYKFASFKRPRGKPDGNTIAYDKSRFTEVSKGCIDFNQFALKTQFKDDIGFQTNNICVWVRLRDFLTNEDIYVYNAHLFWNPKRDDVKYFQMGLLLSIIMKKLTRNDLVVIAGDLNSYPMSNTLHLLVGGEPMMDRIEVRDGFESTVLKNCKTIFDNIDKGVLAELGLSNTYSFYGDCAPKEHTDHTDYSIFQNKVFGHKKGFPPFTNYSKDFKSTIDHIIVGSRFKVGGLLGLPSLVHLHGTTALPNKYFPSDHLPIAADLTYYPVS
jgi:mRNA deadenylase 3'-5' endonuclease subunit Ccr4